MSINQLPQTPNVGNQVPNDLWKWLIEMGNRIRSLIDWANTPFSLPAHKATHATGGTDALTPADIGAASATQQSWQMPTLIDSWVAFGAPYPAPQYFKDSIGMVHLRGAIKNGTIGSSAATLPAGYRPGYNCSFSVPSNVGAGIIVVQTDGSLVPIAGSNSSFLLDGASFRAEA